MSFEKNAYHHKNLRAWQKAIALDLKIYEITNLFMSNETFGLASYIRRVIAHHPQLKTIKEKIHA